MHLPGPATVTHRHREMYDNNQLEHLSTCHHGTLSGPFRHHLLPDHHSSAPRAVLSDPETVAAPRRIDRPTQGIACQGKALWPA